MTYETGPSNAQFLPIEELGVGSWRDGPVGSDVPVNAVVLHFAVKVVVLGVAVLEKMNEATVHEESTIDFGLRIKSRAQAENIMRMLADHADEVWPK